MKRSSTLLNLVSGKVLTHHFTGWPLLMLQSPRYRYILQATLGYLFFGTLWILLSDALLGIITDITHIRWLSQAKGVFFVIITTAILFYGLLAVPNHKIPNASAGQAFRSQFFLFRWPRWVIYTFAIMITLVLLTRQS